MASIGKPRIDFRGGAERIAMAVKRTLEFRSGLPRRKTQTRGRRIGRVGGLTRDYRPEWRHVNGPRIPGRGRIDIADRVDCRDRKGMGTCRKPGIVLRAGTSLKSAVVEQASKCGTGLRGRKAETRRGRVRPVARIARD